MNKILPFTLGLSLLLLAGCSMPRSKTEKEDTTLPIETEVTGKNNTVGSIEDCKKAVDQYMITTKSMTVDKNKKITKDQLLTVDYIGRLADGSVFDTSVESVAKACGLYTPSRDYTNGLQFTGMAGQMIVGFDKGIVGMSLGETKTINVTSKEAYGGATISIPLEQLPAKPDGSQYKAQEVLATQNGPITIESINNKEFTIKNAHPLAGKDLIFDITIKGIVN